MRDSKFSRSLDSSSFPEQPRQNTLRDSYGNPITDPSIDVSNEEVIRKAEEKRKSGIFVIPGYADGILEGPLVPVKPQQRSQSDPLPSLNLPDDGSFLFSKDNLKPIRLPSTDLLAPDFAPPELSKDIPSTSNGFQDITGFNANGPIEITDTNFAPRPSDGLLPPKDDSEVNTELPISVVGGFTSPRPALSTNSIFDTSKVTTIPVKYSGGFGGSSGVLGGSPSKQPELSNSIPQFNPTSSFGTIPDLRQDLLPPPPPTFQTPENGQPIPPTVVKFTIPSTDLLAPEFDASTSAIQPQLPIQPAKEPEKSIGNPQNKFTGSFGGAPGILGGPGILGEKKEVPTITTTTVVPLIQPTPINSPRIPSIQTQTKFDRIPLGFGGSAGILSADNKQVAARGPNDLNKNKSEIPQIQTELTAPRETSTQSIRRSDSIQFGGAPGILSPFDNKKS